MSGGVAAGGRTRITARALERVAAAAAGEALGVPGGGVAVELHDDEGRLDLTLRTAVRTVSLGRAIEEPLALERMGGPLLERTARAQTEIRQRVQDLTGYRVSTVVLHLTGAVVRRERRVR